MNGDLEYRAFLRQQERTNICRAAIWRAAILLLWAGLVAAMVWR